MIDIFSKKPNPFFHVLLGMNIISVTATDESEGLNKAMEELETIAE